MRECEIERHLAVSVKKLGGMAGQFVSPGLEGGPGRVVLFTGGVVCFVGV